MSELVRIEDDPVIADALRRLGWAGIAGYTLPGKSRSRNRLPKESRSGGATPLRNSQWPSARARRCSNE